MKVARKTLSYKGINFELNVDINKLVSDMKEKYRSAFAILKNMVRSRERYIRRLHKTIKNRDHQMRMFTICVNIYEKATKLYKLKSVEFDVLAYMYDINHTNLDRIQAYVSAAGSKNVRPHTINRLVRMGYILKSERQYHFYISDKGRQVVENVSAAIYQDTRYYFSNRISKRNWGAYVEKERAFGESKYSEEEIHRRRKQYVVFMQPYWDMGKKKLPADPFIRYSVLRKWMDDKKKAGEYVDPIYDKYLVNIQAKMAETK